MRSSGTDLRASAPAADAGRPEVTPIPGSTRRQTRALLAGAIRADDLPDVPKAGETAGPVGHVGERSLGADPRTEEEVARLRLQVVQLQRELTVARVSTASAGDPVELSDERVLQDVGIYRYHHPLENAVAYRDRLTDLQERIGQFAKSGTAVLGADLFTLDGSLAKGRKMMGDLSKLMLRAYNAEADSCVRSLRVGNIHTAVKRLERAVDSIQKLGTMMELRVNPDYHSLRVEELQLTADYQMKVQEEREAAREERERLREQARVEREPREERDRLDKERSHYANAFEALRLAGRLDEAEELARRLAEIDAAIEQNDYRTANIRAGYVYVISNVGAFGPDVVKIGMTRRLEPRERVQELSSASAPFPYDVHALFFSDDAVTLEAELHRAFAGRRVNRANDRKEFYFVSPAEVRDLLVEKMGGLLEFTEAAEALQYNQSVAGWPTSAGPPRSKPADPAGGPLPR